MSHIDPDMVSRNEAKFDLYLQTTKNDLLCKMFYAMLDVFTDIRIRVTPEGLFIHEFVNQNHASVFVKFRGESFEDYNATGCGAICVEPKQMHTIMSNVQKDDVTCFHFNRKKPKVLRVEIFKGGDTQRTMQYEIYTKDYDGRFVTSVPHDFADPITFPCDRLVHVFKTMVGMENWGTGDTDVIKIFKSKFAVLFRMDNGIYEVNHAHYKLITTEGFRQIKEMGLAPRDIVDRVEGEIVTSFRRIWVSKLMRFFALIEEGTVDLYAAPDYPALFHFTLGTLGSMKIAIVPQMDVSSSDFD